MKKFKRKVLDMLMSNNSGSSLRQQLFDGAPFRSSLLYTAVPQRAASGTTGTFTRATTSTWPNNDGYMVTGVAGEIGFPGARRVRNLVASPSTSIAVSGNKTITVTPGVYVFSMGAEATGTCLITFTGTATGSTGTLTASASARTSSVLTITVGGTIIATCTVQAAADVQIEDVTAQTTQTAGEYVSVGVESAPYYHGSFVDGVKCFPTDLSGNPIPSTTMLGYQAEGARTNLCLQSGSIASAPWVLTTATVSSNAAAGVDGSLSADLVYPTSSGTFRGAYQAITRSATTHTQHITAKAAGFRWLGILNFNGSGGGGSVWYDLQNGVVGSNTVSAPSVVTPYIRPAGNGFYECGFTGTGAVSQFIQFFCADADGSTTATPSGANGLYIDHTQVEAAAFASSRIATTTIALTRDPDILDYSSGDIPNLKTLCATFRRESGVESVGWAVALSDGTISNYESISAASATEARFLGVTGGVTQWDVIPSYTAGTTSKAAFSAATNDIKMAKDGVAQTQDTSATVPTVTQLNVGHVAGSFQFSGNVGGIYGWTRNLSQSEVNAVTA